MTTSNRPHSHSHLEIAHDGTIFLDEIGQLPFEAQAKLLRVLQDRQIGRLGATRPVRVDVRVIAATNQDLEDASCSGSAAVFTATKGPRARLLRSWMKRANASLPVPVSPHSNTVVSADATTAACCKLFTNDGLFPMMSPSAGSFPFAFPMRLDTISDVRILGAAVLRMLEAYAGPGWFRAAVNTYLHRYQYSTASAEDFWTTLARSTGRPLDRIAASYLTQPGVPLVHVTVQWTDGRTRIDLTQQRYPTATATDDTAKRDAAATTEQRWTIPVCLRLQGRDRPLCRLLDRRSTTTYVERYVPWVVGSAAGHGYYRIA